VKESTERRSGCRAPGDVWHVASGEFGKNWTEEGRGEGTFGTYLTLEILSVLVVVLVSGPEDSTITVVK
jgi:hypothetical protein